MTFERQNRLRQGVDFDPITGSDLFFVTLEKAEGHYSPSTMPGTMQSLRIYSTGSRSQQPQSNRQPASATCGINYRAPTYSCS